MVVLETAFLYVLFILCQINTSRILTPEGHLSAQLLLTRLRELEARLFEGSKTAMLDVVLIAVGVGFFVASILYVLACERM